MRSCDQHPELPKPKPPNFDNGYDPAIHYPVFKDGKAIGYRLREKPNPKRRPAVFDQSYDPVVHILVFDGTGALAGYKPRSTPLTPTQKLKRRNTMIDDHGTTPEPFESLKPSDFELLYNQEKAKNAQLTASAEEARKRTEYLGLNRNARPAITAEQGRATLIREGGPTGFLNATRAQKLRAIGVEDPDSIDDDFLYRGWGRGADSAIVTQLQRENPKRFQLLRHAARILNIDGQRRPS